MSSAAKSFNIDGWELVCGVLKPSAWLLREFVKYNSRLDPGDSQIRFLATAPDDDGCLIDDGLPFVSADEVITIRRSLLVAASEQLRALVVNDFREGRSGCVDIEESRAALHAIRNFLYCEDVHVQLLPRNFPLVADRWGLSVLFRACFFCAEQFCLGPEPEAVKKLVETYLPILAYIDAPQRFKSCFELRFGLRIADLDISASTEPAGPRIGQTVPVSDSTGSSRPDASRKKRRVDVAAQKDLFLRHNRETPWLCHGHDMFKVLHERGMLGKVIRYVMRHNQGDYTRLFLDIILRQIEPHVKEDRELIELLSELHWRRSSMSRALEEVPEGRWSPRAWRLLGRAEPCGFRYIRAPDNEWRRNGSAPHVQDGGFLDLVLGKIEPQNTNDEDVLVILRQFDWNRSDVGNALGQVPIKRWSFRAWRLLARAKARYRSWNIDSMRATITADRFALCFGLDRLAPPKKLRYWTHDVEFSLRDNPVGWFPKSEDDDKSAIVRNSAYRSLFCQVGLRTVPDAPWDPHALGLCNAPDGKGYVFPHNIHRPSLRGTFGDRNVWVEVYGICHSCSCDLDRAGVGYERLSIEGMPLLSNNRGQLRLSHLKLSARADGHCLLLMDDRDVRDWVLKHGANCRITFDVHMDVRTEEGAPSPVENGTQLVAQGDRD